MAVSLGHLDLRLQQTNQHGEAQTGLCLMLLVLMQTIVTTLQGLAPILLLLHGHMRRLQRSIEAIRSPLGLSTMAYFVDAHGKPFSIDTRFDMSWRVGNYIAL